MSQLIQKFETLEDQVTDEILERTQEVHTAILALLSKKHHFQIGPPGTAKSLLVERINKRISGLGEEGYFRWLVTNYTTPEELFGGPDFNLLRETGVYKRITARKLPRAYIAFLDEIFKGNSSILNTNLTIMNERLFFNAGDSPEVPLISMFAASNEMPQGDGLWALWDRLHFRHEIKPMQESSSFIKMVSVPIIPTPEHVLSLEDIYEAQQQVKNVSIPDELYEAMKDLRNDFNNEGIDVTERRWVESTGIIKAEAFLNGREIADIEDMRPLMHVLWSDLDTQRVVKKKVLELANPIDKEASDILDRLIELEVEFKEAIADTDNQKALAKQAIEIHNKVMKANKTIKQLEEQSSLTGRKSEYLESAQTKFKSLAKRLMRDGFQADPDDL